MQAVQTLWTAGRPLLKDRFGWLTPMHHLMAWCLSALLIRRNFDELVLYTDSPGAKMLIDNLNLPYTKVEDFMVSMVTWY